MHIEVWAMIGGNMVRLGDHHVKSRKGDRFGDKISVVRWIPKMVQAEVCVCNALAYAAVVE